MSPRAAAKTSELERRVAELETELARERASSSALRDVSAALGSPLELDGLLELILDRAREVAEADRATLYLRDDLHGELVSLVQVGGEAREVRLRMGQGIAGLVAERGEPLRIADAQRDPRFDRRWDRASGYVTKNLLTAPLRTHEGTTIGVVQVLNKRGAAEFSAEDEAWVTTLAVHAAIAIENSRLFLAQIQQNRELYDAKHQLERSLRDLKLLLELEQRSSRAENLEELIRPALAALAQACDARGAALLLADEATGDLVQYALAADAPEALARHGIKSGEGFLTAAMASDAPLDVYDALRDPRFHAHADGRIEWPFDRVLALRLDGDDGALGALAVLGQLGAEDSRDFGSADRELLALVGANLATAVRLFRAGQARERSERLGAIGRLLSQIIHDFKSPMTVISGYVQLMAEEESHARRAEYAEHVVEQVDALAAMQREVLEFARGEKTLFVRRVFLKKFFSDLARSLAIELTGKPIELKLDVDTKLVARFDEARMARALHNLARNAIEAMGDAGGELRLGARLARDALLFTVSDTGPGIPPELEGRLFQPFVTAGKVGGTGLGLAIVKKIAEEHDGSVTVTSSTAGTTFELSIAQPRDKKDARPGPGVARSSPRRPAAKASP